MIEQELLFGPFGVLVANLSQNIPDRIFFFFFSWCPWRVLANSVFVPQGLNWPADIESALELFDLLVAKLQLDVLWHPTKVSPLYERAVLKLPLRVEMQSFFIKEFETSEYASFLFDIYFVLWVLDVSFEGPTQFFDNPSSRLLGPTHLRNI